MVYKSIPSISTFPINWEQYNGIHKVLRMIWCSEATSRPWNPQWCRNMLIRGWLNSPGLVSLLLLLLLPRSSPLAIWSLYLPLSFLFLRDGSRRGCWSRTDGARSLRSSPAADVWNVILWHLAADSGLQSYLIKLIFFSADNGIWRLELYILLSAATPSQLGFGITPAAKQLSSSSSSIFFSPIWYMGPRLFAPIFFYGLAFLFAAMSKWISLSIGYM